MGVAFRAHKIRLYPTLEQEQHLRRTCGVARFAWNWGLTRWKQLYEAGEKVDAYRLRRELNAVKREQFPWMMEVTKCAPMVSLMNLGDAWRYFFRTCKQAPSKKWQPPKFKKRGHKDAFTVEIERGNFSFEGPKIRLPKLGWIRIAESLRYPEAKPLSVTIKRTADRWYAVVNVELSEVESEPAAKSENQASVVGIDLGLSTFATLSTGEKVEHPRYLRSSMGRLRRLQQALARKQKGSRNHEMAKLLVARKRASVANQRQAFLHKLSTRLCHDFDHIVIEDLAVQPMSQALHLGLSVSDSGFAEFRRQITYKARRLTIADRFFASTKTCYVCGEKTDLSLSDRTWTCSSCGVTHDRDFNAARNLESLGQTATSPKGISPLAASGDLHGRSMKEEVVQTSD